MPYYVSGYTTLYTVEIRFYNTIYYPIGIYSITVNCKKEKCKNVSPISKKRESYLKTLCNMLTTGTKIT